MEIPNNSFVGGLAVIDEAPPQDDLVLAPEWVDWLIENYVDGVPLVELAATLEGAGVPPAVIRGNLRQLKASALLGGLRKKVVFHDQLQSLVDLKRSLAGLGPVTTVERRENVSAHDFFENYYAANRPVILTDVAHEWPALKLWSRPAYFAETFGDTELTVCMGRESDPYCDRNFAAHLQTTTMRKYVAWLESAGETNDGYLISNNRLLENECFHRLLEDVVAPQAYVDPNRFYTYMSFWFGPAGTRTPLHHDGNNILFCQVVGEKEFYLVSPWETELMRRAEGYYAHTQVPPGFVGEGLREPDPAFPWRAQRVVLKPGEALFLPVGWWHQVRALQLSVSLSFLNFRTENQFKWYAPGKLNEL